MIRPALYARAAVEDDILYCVTEDDTCAVPPR